MSVKTVIRSVRLSSAPAKARNRNGTKATIEILVSSKDLKLITAGTHTTMKSRKLRPNLEDFDIVRVIGKGGFSTVFQGNIIRKCL